MKTKILHVTQSLGGVRTYIESVIKNSNHVLFDHIIVAPEHFEFQQFCKKRNVTYYPVKIQRSINPIKDIKAFFQVLSIIKSEDPDIVQTHSAKGGFIGRIAARIGGKKVIYMPHAFSYLSFKGAKRIIFYSIEYLSRSLTDVLLCVSHSEANRALYELGYDNDKVSTIVNAVRVSNVIPLRNYQKCMNIGMIGRLTYQKNPLLFLRIATEMIAQYPNLKFTILGAGMTDHLSCEIEEYLTENDLRGSIEILAWGDSETSRKYLFGLDAFVMTSVFEGLSFSLIEAMSYGLPCVVSKVDGNTDVIQNYENGFSCLTLDEFKTKLSLLVENEALRRKIGYAGYEYVKNFHDIDTNTKQLEVLYAKLANGEVFEKTNETRYGDQALNNLNMRSVV